MTGKNYIRGLCGIAGILLFLIAALFAGMGKSREEEAETCMVSDISAGAVAGMAVTNAGGMTAFVIQGKEIEVVDAPEGTEFSDSVKKAFLYQMAHMPAIRKMDTVDSLKKYGLEEYRAAVVLLLKDGSRERFFLGDPAPFDSGWYLRKENDENLYLVDNAIAEMMQYTVDDFRRITVLPEDMKSVASELTRLTLRHQGECMEIRCGRREGTAWYFLEKPYQVALNWQKVQSELLEPVSDLKCSGFVSEGASFEEYGFYSEDAYQLILETEENTWELFFLPTEENDFYCAETGNSQVVLISGEAASFLTCSPAELMDATLYPGNAADMESVEVSAEGISGTLRISGQGELLHSYCNEKLLSQAETIDLFETLTMLPPAEVFDSGEELSGKSLLTIYFKRKDGTEDIVNLIPVSERRCAVVMNGTASFTTYTATAEEILRVLRQVF